MITDFDSQPDIIQGDNLSSAETTAVSLEMPAAPSTKDLLSPLKLVTSTAVSGPVHKSVPSQRHYFMAEVRRRSPDIFIMVAQDPFHYLSCELPLKFEESEGVLALTCQFPTICDNELVDFIEEDEDLLGMALISFHMQILKNLFLFCAAHHVQNLIIKTREDQLESLGIYQKFIKYVDRIPAKKGIALEITIPFLVQSLAECDALINEITEQFRQTLWRNRSNNSAIREYLKSNLRLSIVV